MIVVAQHRNQYYGRNRVHGPARFGSLGSPPGRCREAYCRSFESGAGLFQTQSKSCKKPVTKRALSGSLSPKTPEPSPSPSPSPSVNSGKSDTEDQKKSRKVVGSNVIVTPFDLKVDVGSSNVEALIEDFPFSELWAGPAYSNSPPPSSLPMPNFTLRPKRTVSFELPASASDIDLRPIAMSAPASPTRERSLSPGALFDSTDFATQTLRRILNLEITDG